MRQRIADLLRLIAWWIAPPQRHGHVVVTLTATGDPHRDQHDLDRAVRYAITRHPKPPPLPSSIHQLRPGALEPNPKGRTR